MHLSSQYSVKNPSEFHYIILCNKILYFVKLCSETSTKIKKKNSILINTTWPKIVYIFLKINYCLKLEICLLIYIRKTITNMINLLTNCKRELHNKRAKRHEMLKFIVKFRKIILTLQNVTFRKVKITNEVN